MAKITYTNKVALNENPEIADINKVKDTDMNEIKTVVNGLDDNIGTLSNLTTTAKTSAVAAINELNSNKASTNEVLIQNTEPTAADNKIWINDGQIGTPASEITNSYSTSTGIGYSANYINNMKYERMTPADFLTLSSGFSFGETNIFKYKNHYTGTVTIKKSSKFAGAGTQETIGTINSNLGAITNNINTFGVTGATADDIWSVPENFAYIYITNTNTIYIKGKSTDAYVKFNIDVILN